MSYTPVELRHVKVGRSLFGYNRATVEQLIEEVAQSFEATWRERGELGDKVESLEKQIAELRGREHLLTQTLVAAEQAASDVRERARREAEVIVQEAHNEARAIGRSAHAERERLLTESKRIEGMLRGALGMMETEAERLPVSVPAPRVEAFAPEPVEESVPEPVEALAPEPVEESAPGPVEESAPEAVEASAPWPVYVPTPDPVHASAPEPVDMPAPEPEPGPAPEPLPVHEPEPEVEHMPAVFAPALYEQPAPEPAPVVHMLPPVSMPEPEPELESEYGWAREDTREFEPISGLPELEPEPELESEPEHDHERSPLPVAEPVLERIPGAASRDFDWGE